MIANGGYIQILRVNPDVLHVPYYDPLVVFASPRPGFAIAGAIRFGPAISIGAVFGGWGRWLAQDLDDPHTRFLIDRRSWGKAWTDRSEYLDLMCIHRCKITDQTKAVEELYARHERPERLRRAICRLPSTLSNAVEIHQLSDRSVKEIVELAGLSVAATKFRLLRARIVGLKE